MKIALFIQDSILNCPALSQLPGASFCGECCITSRVIICELAHCTTIERLFIVSFSGRNSQPGETTAEFSLKRHTCMTHTHALQAARQSEPVYSSCFTCGRGFLTKAALKYITPKGFSCVCVRIGAHTQNGKGSVCSEGLYLSVSLPEWYHIPQPCPPPSAVRDNNAVETLCLRGEGFKSITLRLGVLPGGRDKSEVRLEVFFF